MTANAQPTELEQLGPDYKSFIAKSLLAVAVVASIVTVAPQVAEYVQTERTEISELSLHVDQLDALKQTIKFDKAYVRDNVNRATDFDTLRTLYQNKKAEVDQKIDETGIVAKLLNQHETRAERSEQYDQMVKGIDSELQLLEAKGVVPFRVMAQRRAELENAIDGHNLTQNTTYTPR
jgi:hypothetical protein